MQYVGKIIEDVPCELYHANPALGSSRLVDARETGLKYWALHVDPEREPRDSTKAQDFGTDVHTLLLEPNALEKRIVEIPIEAPKRPTKAQLEAKKPSDATVAAIEWWTCFDSLAKGRRPVMPSHLARVRAVAARIRAKNSYQEFFDKGRPELSMFWKCERTGIDCKVRVDWLSDFPAIVDIKTTKDASSGSILEPQETDTVRAGFAKEAENYHYAIKAAHYEEGVFQCTGKHYPFVFFAIDNKSPFDAAFYWADDDMLAYGRMMRDVLMDRIKEWTETGIYPGYPDRISKLGRPKYGQPAPGKVF